MPQSDVRFFRKAFWVFSVEQHDSSVFVFWVDEPHDTTTIATKTSNAKFLILFIHLIGESTPKSLFTPKSLSAEQAGLRGQGLKRVKISILRLFGVDTLVIFFFVVHLCVFGFYRHWVSASMNLSLSIVEHALGLLIQKNCSHYQ